LPQQKAASYQNQKAASYQKMSHATTDSKKKGLKMNKAAQTKHEIYNKLTGFTEQDLGAIADYIDFMRHKKRLEEKKLIKLEGVLRGYNIDFSDLKKFKEQTWQHVNEELVSG
jgi:hypothetical protein